MQTVSWAGSTYNIPNQRGDTPWSGLSDFCIAVASKGINTGGGNFTLLADLNFGANFGLVSTYFKSRTANIAAAGQVRLARADTVSWRNQANGADLALSVNSSNQLLFNSVLLATAAAALTASRALVSDSSGNITVATTTSTEIGYVNGVTSAIQTQLNAKAPSASPTFTGTVTLPVTADRALQTGTSSVLEASATTKTELGYVSGVTSAIQTQINAKISSANPTFTGVIKSDDGSNTAPAYTFTSDADNGMYLIGANNPALTAGGTKIVDMKSTGVAVKGNNLGGAAATGFIGEILQGSRQRGSELGLSTGTPANVCSLSITAGVWLIVTEIGYEYDSTTSNTTNAYSLSKTSVTLTNANTTMLTPTSDGEQRGEVDYATTVHGNTVKCYAPIIATALITSTTTYFLVAVSTFTVSTVNVFGSITATRIG